MGELVSGVNWIAVVAGFILSFMLGWLWYSPRLFGEKWAQGAKVEFKEDMQMPITPLVVQAAATFLLSWVVGVGFAAGHPGVVILVTLTIMMLMVAGGMFSQKSGYTIRTEAGFVLAMVVVMSLCQVIL